MTREEFSIVVKGLKAVYTQQTFIPDKDAFNVWYELLKDLDYATCNIAVQRYMVSEKFPPTIADIREYVFKNSDTSSDMSDAEAWDMVRKAISDSTYHAEDRFNELPQAVRKAVGTPNQLRIWAMDTEFNDGVCQSHFLRNYRNVCENEKQLSKIPSNIRGLIEGTTQKLIGESR